MTRTVERSIDRPIPEWREAIEFLRHTSNSDFSTAFPGIMALRAYEDSGDQKVLTHSHLNPLWARAMKGHADFDRWLRNEALDA